MGEALKSTDCDQVIVYFVDDDRGMVSATSQWLSLSGLTIRAFADPSALLKVFKPGQPCVVVSDIRMPRIDGLELMKLIRAKDKTIPVILITGHGDIPLAVEAMKLGAFEFVQKPFSPEKLLQIVQNAQQKWHSSQRQENIIPDEKPVVPEKVTLEKSSEPVGNLSEQVDDFEKELIETAMQRHRGVIPRVIEELDIPRRTLNAKMKKYGIIRAKFR